MDKNNDKRMLRIGKVSEIYDIPVSTLHYWEKKGLVHPHHNEENNYSEYDVGELFAKLGDVIFFRNIDMPIDDVQKIHSSPPDVLRSILEKNKILMAKKLEDYKKRLAILENKIAFIDEINSAEPDVFVDKEIPFNKVVEIQPQSTELIRKYLTDLNSFVIVGNIDEKGVVTEFNGIAVEDDHPADAIFVKQQDCLYLMTYCRIPAVKSVPINSAALIEKLRNSGYTAQQYICQFLINLCDEKGILYDYYRIWFKVEKIPANQ